MVSGSKKTATFDHVVTGHVALPAEGNGDRIVWRGFSMRRDEVYDCWSGDYRLT